MNQFDEISKKQYANLRKNFNKLVSDVLGDDYYNMGWTYMKLIGFAAKT